MRNSCNCYRKCKLKHPKSVMTQTLHNIGITYRYNKYNNGSYS